MTLAMAIRSFFELSAIVLLVIGFLNEKKVIAFEQKLFRAVRIRTRRYLRRKAAEARPVNCGQSRAPASQPEEFRPVTVVCNPKRFSRVA